MEPNQWFKFSLIKERDCSSSPTLGDHYYHKDHLRLSQVLHYSLQTFCEVPEKKTWPFKHLGSLSQLLNPVIDSIAISIT